MLKKIFFILFLSIFFFGSLEVEEKLNDKIISDVIPHINKQINFYKKALLLFNNKKYQELEQHLEEIGEYEKK